MYGCCCSLSGEGFKRWEKPERFKAAWLPETTDAYEGRRALSGGSPAEARESPLAKFDEPCCCWYGFVMVRGCGPPKRGPQRRGEGTRVVTSRPGPRQSCGSAGSPGANYWCCPTPAAISWLCVEKRSGTAIGRGLVLVFEISVKVQFKPGNRGVARRLGLCTRTRRHYVIDSANRYLLRQSPQRIEERKIENIINSGRGKLCVLVPNQPDGVFCAKRWDRAGPDSLVLSPFSHG